MFITQLLALFTTSSSYCLGLPFLVLLYIVLSRFRTLPHGPISFLSSYCFRLLILALFHFVDYFFCPLILCPVFFLAFHYLVLRKFVLFHFVPSYNVENACTFDADDASLQALCFFCFCLFFCFVLFCFVQNCAL